VDGREGPNPGTKHGHSHRKYNIADGSFCMELFPGRHTLKLCYHEPGQSRQMRSEQPREIEFEAQPGLAYTVKAGLWKNTTVMTALRGQKNEGDGWRLVGSWEPEVVCAGPIPRFFSVNGLLPEPLVFRPKDY
jgi:hypothetical protein